MKKYLFVSCREGVSSIFSREHPLFPFFLLIFYLFSLSHISCLSSLFFSSSSLSHIPKYFFLIPHFSSLICHLSFLISNLSFAPSFSFVIYKIVLKMKSYEILMQNIRLLQKEVLLLHLI